MAEQIVTLKGDVNLGKSSPQMQPIGVKFIFASISGPTSYTTGGEDTIGASDFGLTEMLGLISLGGEGQYTVEWDKANGKISWYIAAVEEGNTDNLSGITCNIIAVGYKRTSSQPFFITLIVC